MQNCLKLLILSLLLATGACTGEKKPATPLETFKTYSKAIKKKDTATMKMLLSVETLKMHEQEAKAQGVTVDDIVMRETLITEGQTSVEFRHEKIDGEKATLEVRSFRDAPWQTMLFVLENGEWKIDKKGSADLLLKEIEEENRKAEEEMNRDRQPVDDAASPTPTPEPLPSQKEPSPGFEPSPLRKPTPED